TTNGVGVLDKTEVSIAHHTSLLHRLFEIVRAGEPARAFETVPIQDNGYFARIVYRQQNAMANFSCGLSRTQVRIEGFFPSAIIRDFVPNNHMNHDKSSRG